MSPDHTNLAVSASPGDSNTGVTPEEEVWLVRQDGLEALTANRIVVQVPARRLHPVLESLCKPLLDKAKRMEKLGRDAQRVAERNARLLAKPGRTVETRLLQPIDYEWRRFIEDGQPLETSHKAVCLRITPGTLERAMAILTGLFLAAEKRGHTVSLAEDKSRFHVAINGAVVEVRMTERLDVRQKTKQDLYPGEKLWGMEKIKTPTGVLRLFLSSRGTSEVEVADKADKPLQDGLNQIFCRMNRLALRHNAVVREWAERDREWEQERARLEEEKRRRQENEQRAAQELGRRAALLAEAQGWQHAALIRSYVTHVDQRMEKAGLLAANLPVHAEWRDWALAVADEMDRSASRITAAVDFQEGGKRPLESS